MDLRHSALFAAVCANSRELSRFRTLFTTVCDQPAPIPVHPYTTHMMQHLTVVVVLLSIACCALPPSVAAQNAGDVGDRNLLTRPDIGAGQLFPANVSVAAGATIYMRLLSAVDDQTQCTYRRPAGGVDAVAGAGDKCVRVRYLLYLL